MAGAALLFNPKAGRGSGDRVIALERARDVLLQQGIDAKIIPTVGPGTAGAQAVDAVHRGAHLVFACGGDGTLHEVVQGLAQHPSATVGIIPLGSANALARHLRLSFDPAEAARQQLCFERRVIPLGRITCQTADGLRSRWFAVMAGAGPDGMLVYRMLASGKRRLGRWMYYVRAARLFLDSPFPAFHVTAAEDSGTVIHREAISAMAIRVGDLGGVFSPLIRGADPADEALQLTLTQPPHRLTLPAWFATSWTRLHRWNPYTQHLRVREFTCRAASGERVHVQADGEWIGTTPIKVELVPDALRLLMPTSRTAR